MVRYNWNTEKFKLMLENLYREYENHPSNELFFDIDTLETVIYEDEDMSRYKLIDIYKYIKKDLLKKIFIWEDIDSFNQLSLYEFNGFNCKRNSLSKDDLLTIAHDFYKSFDKDIFFNFMKNFKKRNNNVSFINTCDEDIISSYGFSFYLHHLKEGYISIDRKYTIEDIITVIHEYAHLLNCTINPDYKNMEHDIFREITSLFMEFVAYDYTKKYINHDESIKCLARSHNDLVDQSNELVTIFNLINTEKILKMEYKTNKELKSVGKSIGIESTEIEDILLNRRINPDVYVSSYIFALELYNLYLKDKEKALYCLKKIIFMKYNDNISTYNEMKKLGLIPNSSLRSFEKRLVKDVKSLKKH